METINRIARLQRRGSALPTVMSVLVILLATGAGLLSLGLDSRIFATRTSEQIGARCAADAGLEKALFEINEKLKAKAWDDPALPWETDQTLPNCDATFSYKIVARSIVSNREFDIASVGECGNIQKTIYATTRLKGLFEYATLTKEAMILKSDTLIDGYNSLDPADTDVEVKIATTSTSDDQIILNPNVTVDGEVLVGVDGDPDMVIKDLGATTEDRYSMTEDPPFPQITAPALPDKGTNIYALGTSLKIGPADSGKYTAIELLQESAKIKGTTYTYPSILQVDGGRVVLHVAGDIRLDNSCEIIVTTDSSLILYVDGDIVCHNGSSIGYEGSPDQPRHLQLYATGEGEQSFDIKAKSSWTGVIYAPNADIDLYANGDVYGSIVGDSFEFKAGGNLYYDEALRDVTIYDVGVRFVVNRWREE